MCLGLSLTSCFIRCAVSCSESILGKVIILLYLVALVITLALVLVAGVSLYNWTQAVGEVLIGNSSSYSPPYTPEVNVIAAIITTLRLNSAVQKLAPNIFNMDGASALNSAYTSCCANNSPAALRAGAAQVIDCFWAGTNRDCSTSTSFDKTAVPGLLEFVSPFVLFLWALIIVVTLSIIFSLFLVISDLCSGGCAGANSDYVDDRKRNTGQFYDEKYVSNTRRMDTPPVAYKSNTVQHYNNDVALIPSAPPMNVSQQQHIRQVSNTGNVNDGINLSTPAKYYDGTALA